MATNHDAVVVGAGPNGLSAAILLAESGYSVIVLEAEDHPGGAVKTDALTIPGFLHDTFSGVYPATAASPVFARMPLDKHGLRLVHPPIAMAHVLDEGRGAALHRDLDRTAASLDELNSGDGEAWRRFISPYLKVWPALRQAMLGGFPPVGGTLRAAAGLGFAGSLEAARMILQPVSALADELFESDGAKAWLYGSALHGDVAPDASGSAVFGFYLNLLGHAVGWPVAEGGSGSITHALVRYLESLGGKLRVNAPVERVLAEHGKVRGVVVTGGDLFGANVVICDVTPKGLIGIAGSVLPDSYRKKMARYRYGPGSLKVDWALSGPVPWSYEAARTAGTIHIGGGPRELSSSVATEKLGGLPERPFLLAAQPTVADPSRAPEGCHTLWAYTHVPSGADARGFGEHVEKIEAQIERFAPGFRELVLGRHVLAPVDLEGRNRNLVGGDVNAGSQAPDQLFFRPLPSLSPYRTPVRGLYIGSASTFPGGAVHGVPGDAAARAALTDLRLRRVRSTSAP